MTEQLLEFIRSDYNYELIKQKKIFNKLFRYNDEDELLMNIYKKYIIRLDYSEIENIYFLIKEYRNNLLNYNLYYSLEGNWSVKIDLEDIDKFESNNVIIRNIDRKTILKEYAILSVKNSVEEAKNYIKVKYLIK